jgi:endonuclease/exonuclease/phosphatase family metal-dependent hydrolase
MRTRLVVVAAASLASMSLAACSDDPRTTGSTSSAASISAPTTATTAEPDVVVRAVTLNVLHGIFCAADTDFCQATDRAVMVAGGIAASGCPELVGFQEIGPAQATAFPEAMAGVCEGRYELAWEAIDSPDRAMIFTTLPIVDRGYLDLAAFPWEAYRVRVATEAGPVDFLTTHFASSVNNPDCTAEICPPVCSIGIPTNECNAHEVVAAMDALDGAAIQIVSGDLNATPGSPTVTLLADAGFADGWLASGLAECDPTTGAGCTGDRPRPENALDGLDVTTGRYTERIDYILIRPATRCDVVSKPMFAEPLETPIAGLYWASDHAGVSTEFTCTPS